MVGKPFSFLALVAALSLGGEVPALGPYGGVNLPSVPMARPGGCLWNGEHLSRPDCVDPAGPSPETEARSAIGFEDKRTSRRDGLPLPADGPGGRAPSLNPTERQHIDQAPAPRGYQPSGSLADPGYRR